MKTIIKASSKNRKNTPIKKPNKIDIETKARVDEAIECINRGWSIIRLVGKQPLDKGWTNFPKTTIDEVNQIASDGNFGIRAGEVSDLIVIDVDLKNGGLESWARLKKDLGLILDGVPTVKTGGGGFHFYFKYPGKIASGNSQGKLGRGIDIKTDGGQVVAPSSKHPETSKIYQWILKPSGPLSEFPQKLLDFLKKPAKEKIHKQKNTADIIEGDRNTTLFNISRTKFGHGSSSEDVLAYLKEFNNTHCKPPLEEKEVLTTFQSTEKHDYSDKSWKYFISKDGALMMNQLDEDGDLSPILLATFDIKITQDITEDNGIETAKVFVLEGTVKNIKILPLEISSTDFQSLKWTSQLGAKAILSPGNSSFKDFTRHAIQCLSTNIQEKKVFTHLGWREVDENLVYLNANGALGGENIEVKLSPELQRYRLPSQPEHEIEAIRVSLSFLDIGKSEITYPLLAMVYLSAMTTLLDPLPDFSGYLYGQTQTYKTSIAALALCHFGDFTPEQLTNFKDTANSLEKRAFLLKDTLMILDDLHPSAKKFEAQNKLEIAERLIRAFGNRTGRGRLNADTSEKARFYPRGFLLITGEDLPTGQSTLARILILPFDKTSINRQKLTEIQTKSDLLPHAMSSFLLWLKDNMKNLNEKLEKEINSARNQLSELKLYGRAGNQLAFLHLAFETFLQFAYDKQVLSEDQFNELANKASEVFVRAIKKQSNVIKEEDPIVLFESAVRSLLDREEIKLVHKDKPLEKIGHGFGQLVGFFDDNFTYLFPSIYGDVQKFYAKEDSHFPLKKTALSDMLRDRGMLLPSKDRKDSALRVGDDVIKVWKIVGRAIIGR